MRQRPQTAFRKRLFDRQIKSARITTVRDTVLPIRNPWERNFDHRRMCTEIQALLAAS